MKNTDLLSKAINTSNADELYQCLSRIGTEDIEKLIGFSFLLRVVIRKLRGNKNGS